MASTIGDILVRIGIVDDTKSLDQIQRKFLNLGREIESIGKKLTIGVTLPMAGLGATAIKAAADLEALKNGLASTVGSAEEAERQLKSLKAVAQLPGLGFREAVQGATNLQAAGLSAQTSERALRAFGNALATVGKGKADLFGVITALSQIQSKGKVSAEEINQLAERIPQIRVAMQNAFGKGITTEALGKMGIDSATFIEAIIKEFEKLPRVTGGLKNELENLSDAWFMVSAEMGKAIAPAVIATLQAIQPLIARVGELAQAFSALPVPAQQTILAITALAAVSGPLLFAIGGTINGIRELVKVYGTLKAIIGALNFSAFVSALSGTAAASAAAAASTTAHATASAAAATAHYAQAASLRTLAAAYRLAGVAQTQMLQATGLSTTVNSSLSTSLVRTTGGMESTALATRGIIDVTAQAASRWSLLGTALGRVALPITAVVAAIGELRAASGAAQNIKDLYDAVGGLTGILRALGNIFSFVIPGFEQIAAAASRAASAIAVFVKANGLITGPLSALKKFTDDLKVLFGVYPEMDEGVKQAANGQQQFANAAARAASESLVAADAAGALARAQNKPWQDLGSLSNALRFFGADSKSVLEKNLADAQTALRTMEQAYRKGGEVAAGALQAARKKVQDAKESLFGRPDDSIEKAFGALGLRNLEKEVADAVKALASLEKAGKLTGDRLDDAAGHVERLKRALRLANETGSTEPAKFVDPRSVDEIERVNEAFAKVKEERKKARDAADNYNQTLHEMSLLEAGVTDGISNETILLADLQRTVQGLNPEFNALVLRMEETSNQWKKLGEGFQLGMPDMGGLQKTMQVYADLKALGIKSEADLAKTIAQARNVAESQQADIGLGTRLAARVKQYDAELQLLKEALMDQTEEERKATEDQIKVKEKLLTSTQKQLDKITGAHRRASGILKGFWQTMSNQVSTILTDLSRQIVDVLFPREKTDSRDVAAITELGLRAGVSGKQLEDLTKVVQDLATATGTDFRAAATGAADVFRAFGVGVADQIPLLRQLFAVSQVTGTALSELFSGVVGNADLFKALGFSAGQAAVLVGQLSKAGYDTSKIMGALNSALKTLREKGFVNPGAALQDLIRRIREAGTESEATSLAVRYFGDNAQELVRIIRTGKLNFASINAEIDKTSESLEKAAEKTKELAKEQSALGKIMSEVWRSAVRILIEGALKGLAEWLKKSGKLKALWEDIKGVFIAIGKAIGIINRESEKTKVPGTGTTPGKTENSTDPVGSSKNPNHVVLDSPVPLPVEVQNFPVGEGVKPTHVIIDGPIPLPVVGMVVSTPMPTLPGGGSHAFPGGGGGGGIASAIGGLAGTINVISGVVGAIGSIGSFIQGIRQEGTMNAVEHNTRYLMIYTGEQADSVLETLHVIRNRFLDFTGGAGGNGYGFGTLIDLTAQMNDRLMAILERIGSFASVPIPHLAAAGASDTVVSGGGDTYYNTFNIEAADPKRTAEEVSRHLTNRGIRHRTRIR